MKRYFYVERDDLSDRGFNKGLEVYLLQHNGYPKFIAGNYRMNSAAWKGYVTQARQLIAEKCGHRLKSVYNESWHSKNVQLRDINGH